MSDLLGCITAHYRDPLEIDVSAGDPIPMTIDEFETAFMWAVRDGDDELALVLANEIKRLRIKLAWETEAILVGSAAGIWRLH